MCPIVGGLTGPDRPGLQANNCFAAHPVTSSVERVAGDHEHVGTITGHAAMSPNSTADGRCRPGAHVRRIIDWHAHYPAVVSAAIAQVAGPGDIDNTVDDSQSAALVLHQRSKGDAVVSGSGVHIHWPACIRGASVHVQRVNEALLSRAIDHCIKEK